MLPLMHATASVFLIVGSLLVVCIACNRNSHMLRLLLCPSAEVCPKLLQGSLALAGILYRHCYQCPSVSIPPNLYIARHISTQFVKGAIHPVTFP